MSKLSPFDPGVESDSPRLAVLAHQARTPALFRFLGGVEEGAEFVDVLGEHAGELDGVADLRVGGSDRGEREESAVNLRLELETRADGEWEDRLIDEFGVAHCGTKSTPQLFATHGDHDVKCPGWEMHDRERSKNTKCQAGAWHNRQ